MCCNIWARYHVFQCQIQSDAEIINGYEDIMDSLAYNQLHGLTSPSNYIKYDTGTNTFSNINLFTLYTFIFLLTIYIINNYIINKLQLIIWVLYYHKQNINSLYNHIINKLLSDKSIPLFFNYITKLWSLSNGFYHKQNINTFILLKKILIP
eukprot:64745_1